MSNLCLLLFLLLLPASCLSASELTLQTQTAKAEKPLRYWLYLPDDVKKGVNEPGKGKTYPLVLFLHGGGEGGSNPQMVKKNGLPKLVSEGKEFPFIMVAPQNPSETQHWNDQKLVKLLDEVQAKHPINPSRVYLTGLSRGGYGAWRLAIQNPDRFAAIVPICGGGLLPYAKRLKHVPIWVFHGAKDTTIPISESQRMVDALKDVGGNVKFTVYPDAKHDAWTEAYNNPELYRWMLEQKRSPSLDSMKR